LAKATGWRLILFPPLVVIAFEMFAHARVCPWARRPFALPVACVLCATAGVVLVTLFGGTPLSVGVGTLLLTVSFLAWRRMAGTKIMTFLRR
jgi:hypothetical protein